MKHRLSALVVMVSLGSPGAQSPPERRPDTGAVRCALDAGSGRRVGYWVDDGSGGSFQELTIEPGGPQVAIWRQTP